MADVSLHIVSENSASERRITPSWTIATLKTKLEPITGIPPSCQRLSLKTATGDAIAIEAADEEATTLAGFPLTPYSELNVIDTRPPNARPNFTDTSNVDKYVMPEEEYAQKTDSVLAWKKAQKLGRFDPNAPAMLEAKVAAFAREVEERGIAVGKRCRVGGEDTRRGAVMYVGEVPEIATGPGTWVGVRLDEPVGKNDGSIKGKRYWGEGEGQLHGLFVRPERVEVGDFPPLDDLEDDEDMEEI
ncbi:hypothetical protein MCOR25_008583 [Pyricularia grisea]|uniref:CAP-Gly domain-containing protein n=1 Tax=Pyricularia grisea TaxID=148305 RepID=A0A6P8BKG8_PYRGI|nr:uncharacterized protein PgNI_00212 [Pyricularia grisea]KAI6354468.1 hypothetical protein MCOR25_008583 [Pyricularia grisea]TLD17391.1 hypothetical protein PgNI_00212 [Pyricularia grisea]